MAKKIGIILAADGEAEFSKALQNARKETLTLKSELTKLSAEYDGNANSLEALQKKQAALEKQTENYEKAVKSAKEGLSNAQNTQKKAAERYEELKKALDNARKAQEELKNAGKEGTEEYSKQSKEVELYTSKLEKQGAQCEKCEGKVQDWTKKVNNAETDLIKANNALQKNEQYLKEAENATDSCATSIDNYGNVVSKAAENTTGWTDKLQSAVVNAAVSNGFSLLTDTAKALGSAVVETAKDSSAAAATLAASTGATADEAERYEAIMKQIKGDDFGESYTEVAEVMAQIVQTMGDLSDSDLTWITEAAMTLEDTFGIDVNESIRAVNVMMQSMGVTATEAFDLIAKGAQNGLNRSDELADNLTEYGQIWGQAGFSAEEAFAIMENGLNAGAYNLDKVNDFVKEFAISLSDGRIEDNLDSFSSETQNLFKEWKNGNATTADVFYSVIRDLESMTNQQEALTLASETWSALGEDNAMDVITALNDVNTAYKDVQGTMDELTDTKYSDLGSSVSRLGSTVQEHIVEPLANLAIPALTSLANGAADAIDGIADALTPAKDELKELSEEVQTYNDGLAATITNGQASVDNATAQAQVVETLGARLIELNSVEALTTVQQGEMRTIVTELSQYVPELSDAYDTQTGKLKATNEELKNWIENSKAQMVQTALAASAQEIMNDLLDAQVEKQKSDDLVKTARQNVQALREQKGYVEDLATEWEKWTNIQNESLLSGDQTTWNKAKAELDNLRLSYDLLGITYNDTELELSSLDKQIDEAKEEMKGYASQNVELGKTISEGTGKMEEMQTAADNLADSMTKTRDATEDAADTTEEAAESADGMTDSMTEAGDAAKEAGTQIKSAADAMNAIGPGAKNESDYVGAATVTVEEWAEAHDRAAAAAVDGAAAQVNAAETVMDAYTGTAESIKSAMDFNPWSAFEGGDDLTVEEMVANLQSYADGVTNMKENMAYVLETMDSDLSPLVVSSLESMGTEAANTWYHLANTLEKQGSEVGSEGYELVKAFSDQWLENLDIQDETSDVMAANVTAIQSALGELGSTDADFSELQDAITDALSGTDWGALTDGEKEALESAVDVAKSVGIEIPEGLSEGIASGDVTYESALEQINGAIKGKLEGLAAVAEGVGIDIPSEITAGINEGGPAAEAAYQELLELLAGYESTAQSDASTVGAAAASGYSEGLSAGAGDATTAGSTVASAGSDGAEGAESEYTAAGSTAASQYASGLLSGSSAVQNAGITLGRAAQTGLNTQTSGFRNVGVNIAAGVTAGITAGQADAVNAAVQLAQKALQAMKDALGIHSPSKVFQDEVGAQIGAGTAKGVEASTTKAVKAAEKMAKQTTLSATAWAKKYGSQVSSGFGVSRTDDNGKKKSAEDYYSDVYQSAKSYVDNMGTLYNLSNAQLLSYWTGVLGSLKKGTQAWYDARSQVQTLTQTVKDEISETYDDMIDAGETYVERQQATNGMSLQAEKAYWEGILKTVKKGSDAWYTVKQKINSIKSDIGTVSNASSLIDTYSTYYELSEKAEMDYWDAVRKQYTAGTDERLKADEKYLDAKEAYYDKLTSLEEDYVKDVKDIDDELADNIQALTDTYNENVKSRTKTIASAFSLFDEFSSESATGKTLLYNIQTQAAGYQDWTEILKALGDRGILSEDLLEELTEQGPDISAQLHALNTLTDAELTAYNEAYQKKMDIAAAQAEKEYADSKADLERQTAELKAQAELDKAALTTAYFEAVAQVNTGMSTGLASLAAQIKSIASDQTTALVAALTNQQTVSGAESSTGTNVSNATLDAASVAVVNNQPTAAAQTEAAPAAAATETNAQSTLENKILDIINSGASLKKLSDADRKKHSTLYGYIFDKYKRKTTTHMIKLLADALGVKADETPTSAQKNKVLSALKKKGFRSGGTVYDNWAWMDEAIDTEGPEMVVRKSDNAILTRVKPGDEILDASTAANMAAWGQYSPEAYAAALNTTAALNGATAASQAGTARLEGMMNQVMDVLGNYLPYLAQRQQIVMDGGAVVGQTVGLMSNALAMRSRRTR